MSISYKDKFRKIKNYVDFNFDLRLSPDNFDKKLSRRDKQLITYYHNVLAGAGHKSEKAVGLISDNVYNYSPKSKKGKKAAKEYLGIRGEYKHLKKFPIPRAGKKTPEIDISESGRLVVKEENISRQVELFNRENLATDPVKEVKRLIAKFPASVKQVGIIAGYREMLKKQHMTMNNAELVNKNVNSLMQAYKNHGQWLNGLIGYGFRNQAEIGEYKETRRKIKEKAKKRNKKKRIIRKKKK